MPFLHQLFFLLWVSCSAEQESLFNPIALILRAMIGEIDGDLDKRTDLGQIRAAPLKPISHFWLQMGLKEYDSGQHQEYHPYKNRINGVPSSKGYDAQIVTDFIKRLITEPR